MSLTLHFGGLWLFSSFGNNNFSCSGCNYQSIESRPSLVDMPVTVKTPPRVPVSVTCTSLLSVTDPNYTLVFILLSAKYSLKSCSLTKNPVPAWAYREVIKHTLYPSYNIMPFILIEENRVCSENLISSE